MLSGRAGNRPAITVSRPRNTMKGSKMVGEQKTWVLAEQLLAGYIETRSRGSMSSDKLDIKPGAVQNQP